MAVTTSSGNGFALYNGVKLPKTPTVEGCPYAAFAAVESTPDTYELILSENKGVINSNGRVYFAAGKLCSYAYTTSQDIADALGISKGEWVLLFSDTTDYDWAAVPLWSNHDILNTDNSVYLAASDPIPLDGYTVIEWDGDTTGLEVFLTGAHYRVADYANPTSAIVVYYGEPSNSEPYVVKTDLVYEEDGLWTIGEEMYAVGTDGTNADFGESGIYFINISGADTYYSKLLAYPASGESEPTYDRTAFLSGLAMGLCGKGNPTFEGSGKMLYNGVELPDINSVYTPEIKAEYPYAFIKIPSNGRILLCVFGAEAHYFEYTRPSSEVRLLFGSPPSWDDGFVDDGIKVPMQQYECAEYSNYQWTLAYQSSDGYVDITPPTSTPHWSNFDIEYNGSVYLAASDPVPVEDAFTKGYHVGAALRRKRVLPVAYLYNGVRLPKLPEWDKETYPYSFINYGGWLYPNSLELYVCKEFTFDGSEVHYTAESLRTPLTEYSEDFAWGDFSPSSGGDVARNWLLWTNTDLVESDGTVYLAATDPVPVYE